MGVIQSSINSMLGSASHAVMAVKGYQALKAKEAAKTLQQGAATGKGVKGISPQEQAAARARQSRDNAVDAKKKQRRNFMDYLKQQPTSLGGKVGDLPPQAQKQIAGQYTKSQRKRLMDMADKGGRDGRNI